MKSKPWFVLAIVLGLAGSLWAQGDRGIIRGTVKDETAAVVPGAPVIATNVATNAEFKTSSGETGDFTIASLSIGLYRVRVENPGFKTLVWENVTVEGGQTVTLELKLELGVTEQTVAVIDVAPLMTTDSARVGSQISNTLVNDLPVVVNGAVRSPFDLAAITPDVTGSGNNTRVGGGRGGMFGMTLDGTSITASSSLGAQTFTVINAPSVEAIAEFSVESSGFKAESGHASGGTVSFVSKSGTNEFHGSAYEFLRNEKLDARNFFAARRAIYKQHNFGFTVGGPVTLPKLYKGRDRTFFFVSYEGFRNRVGATPTPFSVPPPEFWDGDFSNWVDQNGKQIPIYDPATTTLVGNTYVRTPFPNNRIPVDRFDPITKSIIAYVRPLLKPNVPGIVPGTSGWVRQNYVSSGTTRQPTNKTSFKVDQVLTSAQRISFYFATNKQSDAYGPEGPPGLPPPASGNPGFNRSRVYRFSHDYTITPRLLNRFYVGANDFKQNRGSLGLLKGAPLTEGLTLTETAGWKQKGICIPNYPDCNVNFPILNFGGEFSNWGVNASNGSDNIVVEFKDDMTMVSGHHTFKWGYYYNNTHYNGFGQQNIAGNATFSQLGTSVPLVTQLATGGGSAFASFLLGQVSAYALDTPRYIATHYRNQSGYVQDDWRVSDRLTLNLGVRVESNIAPIVGGDQLSDLDLKLPNPGADGIPGALRFAGYGPGRENTRSLVDSWYGVAPRLGLAYTPDSKTTVRASTGVSFGPVIGTGSASHNLGFVQRITRTDNSQGLTPLWYLRDGAPYWSPVPQIDPAVGNGANAPFYNGRGATAASTELNYSLNIQRQLTASTVAEVGYVSTLASRIQSSLLVFNGLDFQSLPANLSPFTASGRTLLNSLVGSAAANAAGIRAPFSAFNTLWGTGATVAQALRPFPQYATIDTAQGGGDRIGHSTYHALQLKLTKRYSAGLTFQGSYVFSKMLTDADSGGGTPMNPFDRRLEKSIASYDQTHVMKLSYSYELPFGPGKRFLTGNGILRTIGGGWRISGIHNYASGTPIALGTTVSFPVFGGTNRPTVATDEGWRGSYSGDFDPNRDGFFQPVSFFGPQPTDRFGNMTRFNPKVRDFPVLDESVSLAKSFHVSELTRLEFRAEAFNLLNRVRFGPLTNAATLQNPNFGLWRTQANTPRQMQLSLKMYW